MALSDEGENNGSLSTDLIIDVQRFIVSDIQEVSPLLQDSDNS